MAGINVQGDYPPALTPGQTQHLTTVANEWAISHGLTVRPPISYTKVDETGSLASAAPFTLFPSRLPMNAFHEALMIQTAYNELYANIAQDEEWLGEVVKGLAPFDDFIANLWDVHLKVKREGYVQDLSLGLFRSDYMIHTSPSTDPPEITTSSTPSPATTPTPTIRQVEFNTIASSFGGLSSRVSSLHRHLLQTAAYPREAAAHIRPELLPTNPSIEKLASGLASAHAAYQRSPQHEPSPQLPCILFITQPRERNVFDQKHIEYALLSHHRIKVFRLAFSEVLNHTHLGHDRTLFYTPPAFPDRTYEVTTLYLRAGYSPSEYENDPADSSSSHDSSDRNSNAWQTRHHLERSRAIKCPSILTHLAGCKKVQQILATPGSPHLDRFFPHPALAARLRRTFAPMFPLDADTPEGQQGRRLATDPRTAAKYVLKPQREGGGNNVYRSAIPEFLEGLGDTDKWAAYVLMEMIEPPGGQRNVVLRNGEVQVGGVICELGVFGTCLWRCRTTTKTKTDEAEAVGDNDGGIDEESSATAPSTVPVPAESGEPGIIANEEAGYLLRTKGDTSEEGGVAAGFGAVDSVCLV